jgi:hypothetical protein
MISSSIPRTILVVSTTVPIATPRHEPKAGIERELREKQPAQPPARVIYCRGGTLKVVCFGETDHPVSQVLLLQQDEDDKNDDDAGCIRLPSSPYTANPS